MSMTTMERKGTKCPWSYFLIRSESLSSFTATWFTISFRLLFKFVLKIFYGSIVVENAKLIPPDGQPWSVSPHPLLSLSLSGAFSIVCANHSNSLTDALCVLLSEIQIHSPHAVTAFSSPPHRTYDTAAPFHQRYDTAVPPRHALELSDCAVEETQLPPSHRKGHSVRQADFHQLAHRVRRDCADKATERLLR